MNFDEFVLQDRESSKWAETEPGASLEGVLPVWVADMDFRIAPSIIEAVQARAAQGIWGYTHESKTYFQSIVNWAKEQHGALWEEDWLVPVPGVVTGLNTALQVLSKPGDSVLLQTPVYHPFYESIKNNELHLLRSPLVETDERYEIDWVDLEQKFSLARVFILCNPHNPSGRIYSREELQRIANLSKQYDVAIIADEIHSDIVYAPAKHHSFLEFAKTPETILLNAPSKTFNIAGLCSSYFIVPDENLRNGVIARLKRNGPKNVNLFALVATEAAYQSGRAWYEEAKHYLQTNRDLLTDFLKKNCPELRFYTPEGTYFLWLDFRQTKLKGSTVYEYLLKEAKLRTSPGEQFGEEGRGFVRINFACTKANLELVLSRLKNAFDALV